MHIAIYSRVSTLDQRDDGQLEDLMKLCDINNWTVVRCYRETVSGTYSISQRPQLKKLLDEAAARAFDKVVVWSVDRLGRSLPHLVTVLAELTQRNVTVLAYKQNLDSASPIGQTMWGMLGVFSEFENNLRRERQACGIAKSRSEGTRFGRPPLSQTTADSILQLRSEGRTMATISKQLGVGLGTVHRVCASRDTIGR